MHKGIRPRIRKLKNTTAAAQNVNSQSANAHSFLFLPSSYYFFVARKDKMQSLLFFSSKTKRNMRGSDAIA